MQNQCSANRDSELRINASSANLDVAQGRPHGLSKSRITAFEQCPKRLWLSVHRPDLAVEGDRTQAAFADGNRIGAIACALHPDGVMIEAEPNLSAALETTANLLASATRRPIFEATFAHDGVLVRVDLMLPTNAGWHVAEVKNTAGPKAYHIGDIATQLWVLRENGVSVSSASVRHIDTSFVLTAEGDYQGLFADTNVASLVEPRIADRADVVAAARTTLAGLEPILEVGDHCTDPFSCSFIDYCGRELEAGPEWPVTLLPDAAGKKIARAALNRGVANLLDLPAASMTNPKLAKVHRATVSGEVYHDYAAIEGATRDWGYPRAFLDFETIAFSIPRWIGTRPYQAVPFQFSCHIVHEDGRLDHHEFLSIEGDDPRRACAEALVHALDGTGAIVAYNASFERGCLKRLAETFPDLAPVLLAAADRLVDLLPITREHYYHRDQRGSWSIKAVLPTVCPELDYSDLPEVRSGDDAQRAFVEAVDPNTSVDRRAAIRDGLLLYCRRDTEAMVELLARLSAPIPLMGDRGSANA